MSNPTHVLEPPQPPNAIETAMVASRSINVKWQHKSQDTSEVTKYILQYKEGEGNPARIGLPIANTLTR